MPARKMRFELFDGEGNKYTVSFEGQMTREKALHLLDLVELLGGVSGEGENPEPGLMVAGDGFSRYEKVRVLIRRHFPVVWFSSREVQSVYEEQFKEPIGLSTVATYLARMTSRGILVRAGASNRLKYKVPPSFPRAMTKQQVP